MRYQIVGNDATALRANRYALCNGGSMTDDALMFTFWRNRNSPVLDAVYGWRRRFADVAAYVLLVVGAVAGLLIIGFIGAVVL